jgi:hypothetical protein
VDVLTQGPLLAGSGVNIAGANADWANPGNVMALDGSKAVSSATSDLLAATNFGFALPTDRAVYVMGILVQLVDTTVSSFTSQWQAQLTKNGTAVIGTAISSGSISLTIGPTTLDVGSQTNLWGTTFTSSEINASTFGVMVNTLGTLTLEIDAIRLTVFYSQIESRLPRFERKLRV